MIRSTHFTARRVELEVEQMERQIKILKAKCTNDKEECTKIVELQDAQISAFVKLEESKGYKLNEVQPLAATASSGSSTCGCF